MRGGDIFFTTSFCKAIQLVFFLSIAALVALNLYQIITASETEVARKFRVIILPMISIVTFFVGFTSLAGVCRVYEEIPTVENLFGDWAEKHKRRAHVSDGHLLKGEGRKKK